ncbi:forkhead box protein J1-B [Drosophila sechellia]|uniref:GM23241 n=2 Tax=Drosophila sechellia TaxID=7238 RepID=B4IL82_DROSE|nr:forkhead box protein J1-B [Drosophila sechellia]EDW53713.1 GM23241 [Drosophila sechellia]
MSYHITSSAKRNVTLQSCMEENSFSQEAEDSDEERELTNLNWLLRNQNLTWPKTIDYNPTDILNSKRNAEPTHKSRDHDKHIKMFYSTRERTDKISHIILGAHAQKSITKRPTASERFETFVNKVKRDLTEYEKLASKYETDVTEKPPFNYSHIIGMAMLQNGRITLQQLCSWIEAKFAFFRVRKKWNNSIRHNLSLHHCFRNRKREERGKGGYWELGVDPKKCDRKRIRNRKILHPTENQTAKFQYEHLTEIQQANSARQNHAGFVQKSKTSSLPEKSEANIFNIVPHEEPNIADKNDEQRQLRRINKEDILKKKSELDTIISSTESFLTEPNLNCFFSNKTDTTNTPIPAEKNFCTFNNFYSEMTPVLASNSNIVEEQNVSNDVSCPSHACNITINYDYTNFQPIVDSIAEQFQCLHDSAEYDRNDDILENLLDVCVTHY